MALDDGLYKVDFQTPLGDGSATIVLNNGTIKGGDSALYYVGTYQQNGEDFRAQVRTDRHTNTPDIQSVFGVDRVKLSVHGSSHGNSATATGTAAEAPHLTFQARLLKLSD